MPGKGRSQKMFVRKHYDSYWKVLADKWSNKENEKDKNKEKDKAKERLEPSSSREFPRSSRMPYLVFTKP